MSELLMYDNVGVLLYATESNTLVCECIGECVKNGPDVKSIGCKIICISM